MRGWDAIRYKTCNVAETRQKRDPIYICYQSRRNEIIYENIRTFNYINNSVATWEECWESLMNFQSGFEELMATWNVSVPFGKCDQSIILTFETLRILPLMILVARPKSHK